MFVPLLTLMLMGWIGDVLAVKDFSIVENSCGPRGRALGIMKKENDKWKYVRVVGADRIVQNEFTKDCERAKESSDEVYLHSIFTSENSETFGKDDKMCCMRNDECESFNIETDSNGWVPSCNNDGQCGNDFECKKAGSKSVKVCCQKPKNFCPNGKPVNPYAPCTRAIDCNHDTFYTKGHSCRKGNMTDSASYCCRESHGCHGYFDSLASDSNNNKSPDICNNPEYKDHGYALHHRSGNLCCPRLKNHRPGWENLEVVMKADKGGGLYSNIMPKYCMNNADCGAGGFCDKAQHSLLDNLKSLAIYCFPVPSSIGKVMKKDSEYGLQNCTTNEHCGPGGVCSNSGSTEMLDAFKKSIHATTDNIQHVCFQYNNKKKETVTPKVQTTTLASTVAVPVTEPQEGGKTTTDPPKLPATEAPKDNSGTVDLTPHLTEMKDSQYEMMSDKSDLIANCSLVLIALFICSLLY